MLEDAMMLSLELSKLRQCECGGRPEGRNIGRLFYVRCSKCHKTTKAEPWDTLAVQSWNRNDVFKEHNNG